MSRKSMRSMFVLGLVVSSLGGAPGSWAASPTPEEFWTELSGDVFKGRPLDDGAGLLALDMPYRAEDAAIVPLTVRATLPPGDPRRVKSFTIIIDQNPAPVAATFELGANSGVSSISTRVRVD